MSARDDRELAHLPVPDADTAPYWEAARSRRLVCRHCRACDRPYHYPRERCPRCLGDNTEWIELSGRGQVHSFTVVHQAASRAFRDLVPYTLALVDLEEGVRMMANVVGPVDGLEIGAPVRVSWLELGDDCTLPVFELVSPS